MGLSANAFSHQDFYITHIVNETSLRIKTSLDFEEIEKTYLICNLIDDLRATYNYCKPIHIDFTHDYINSHKSISFLNIAKAQMTERGRSVSQAAEGKEIIIRIIDREFPILTSLKLVAYAISNEAAIKQRQKQYAYKDEYVDYLLYSISQEEIQTIISAALSENIKKVNAQTYYKQHEPSFKGYSYFLHDGKYHVYYTHRGTRNRVVVVVESLFQLENMQHQAVLLFEDKSSFRYYSLGTEKLNKKHSITLGTEAIKPFKCIDVGAQKILIRYHVYTDRQRDYLPGREILYITDLDKQIDDFDARMRRQ